MIWRPVSEGLASGLAEVRLCWTTADLMEAHAALIAKAQIERIAMQDAERRNAVS